MGDGSEGSEESEGLSNNRERTAHFNTSHWLDLLCAPPGLPGGACSQPPAVPPGKLEAPSPPWATMDAASGPVPAAAPLPSPGRRTPQRPQSDLCNRTGCTGCVLGPLTVPGTPVCTPNTCSCRPPGWSSAIHSPSSRRQGLCSASVFSILTSMLLCAPALLVWSLLLPHGPFQCSWKPSFLLWLHPVFILHTSLTVNQLPCITSPKGQPFVSLPWLRTLLRAQHLCGLLPLFPQTCQSPLTLSKGSLSCLLYPFPFFHGQIGKSTESTPPPLLPQRCSSSPCRQVVPAPSL